MFLLSKLSSALTQPLTWVALAWLWGLVRLWRVGRRLSQPFGPQRFSSGTSVRRAWWALAWPLLLLGLLGFVALPQALLRPLEHAYPVPSPQVVAQHRGFVVLGGAFERADSFQPQVPLNAAVERLTVPLGWLQTQPDMRLVFLGGEGLLFPTGVTEAVMAQQFYREQGIASERVRLESASRTTRENVAALKTILGPDCNSGQWLLVTSAWHMPRSMEELSASGCKLTPYPVDFRSGPAEFALRDLRHYAMVHSLDLWQCAGHEWLGRAVYALTRWLGGVI